MNRVFAVLLAALILVSGLLVLPPEMGGPTQSRAEEYPTTALNCGTEHWRNDTGHTTVDGFMAVGTYRTDMDTYHATYRGYIAIDGSDIDTGGVASLRLWAAFCDVGIYYGGGLDVYYRPATMAAYANDTFYTDAVYVGQLCQASDIPDYPTLAWFNINVPKAAISTGDWSAEYGADMDTVFYIVYSEESAGWRFDNYAFNDLATYMPYVESVAMLNGLATVSYYQDATSWYNYTILPSNRLEYNSTHDMFMYEVQIINYTFSTFEWMTITVGPDLDYLATHIMATVTLLDATTGEWNITDYMGNAATPEMPHYYLHMWFSVPKAEIKTEVHLALWHSTLGEGFFWQKFKVVVNTGTTYNNTTASWIPNPTTYLDSDEQYAFTVMDYFGNAITSRSVYISGSYADVLLSVPVYSVTWNSFRNDTTAISVYFNATGTPWQEHVSGGKEVKMGVREGAYMFRFDYMTSNATGFNTISTTYFYNLTINGTHTINIGTDGIGIIMTTINGNTITIANIETSLMPSITRVYYLLPELPLGGTRSPSTLTADELVFIAYHPYHILDGDIRINGTGTNVSLEDYRPTNGTVRWVNDVLYINANPLAAIVINGTTGNILNLSTAPAYIDITSYDAGDITIWSNYTIQVHRISTFRQVRRLLYTNVPSTGQYYTTAAASNPSTQQYRPTFWYIGYAVGPGGDIFPPDTDSIRLYDNDNLVALQAGRHFDYYGTGVSLMFEYLNASVTRSLQLSYYLDNGTAPLSMPILTYRTYTIEQWKGTAMYCGREMWVNNATASYRGSIQLSLKGLQGVINPKTLTLYDETNNREIPDVFWTYSGTTIMIDETAVGSVAVGESRTYVIYYKLDSMDTEEIWLFSAKYSIGWVNLNAHLLMLIAALGVGIYGTAEFVTSKRQKEEARGMVFILISVFGMIGYLALWILHEAGAI